jgi:hypothetical protein
MNIRKPNQVETKEIKENNLPKSMANKYKSAP